MQGSSLSAESFGNSRAEGPQRKPSIAIVGSHVIQYQAPLFQRLASSGEIDLTVFYCSSAGGEVYHDQEMNTALTWDLPLLAGYRHEILRNYSPVNSLHGWGLVNLDLPRRLMTGRFDGVIFMGWGAVSYWLGFAACLAGRIPFFLYGDSNDIPANNSLRSSLRERVLRFLFRNATGFLVTGRYNAEYYSHYGAEKDRFFFVPWAIDNDRFEAESGMSEAERVKLRSEYDIGPNETVIMFSGKLIARKGPMDLLESFAQMAQRDDAVLLFVGDGSERERLEAFCRERSLKNVRITGFVNQSILPKLYGISDVFVLPSYFDPRATVVNEAMASGLACIVSDRIGPSGDIVKDGENGFVIAAGDIPALTDRLDLFAGDPQLARSMGQRSREIIRGWSYREDVNGILAAARFATTRRENRHHQARDVAVATGSTSVAGSRD
jgi:glycosyltransferase involved in cell wall biosynthesis